MNIKDFNKVVKKYKHCPNCGSSYKDTKLSVELTDDVITISCECGFHKRVDKNNKELE